MKGKNQFRARKFNGLLQLCVAVCWLVAMAFETIAQEPVPWFEFSPAGENISVSMPQPPKEEQVTAIHGDLHVSGTWATTGNSFAFYAIWSLMDLNNNQWNDPDAYLDATADLFWHALLKSARAKARDLSNSPADVSYTKELPANPLPAREYSVSFGKVSGTVNVYVSQQRIFILLAADTSEAPPQRTLFLSSFKVGPQVTPLRPAVDQEKTNIDSDDPIFTTSEVDQRARILEKPEPAFTESARVFRIQGTVVLRAVFSKNGEVTRLVVVRRLPHGLTQSCVAAARAIRFLPAQKDGRSVSTSMQLEYNFNLF